MLSAACQRLMALRKIALSSIDCVSRTPSSKRLARLKKLITTDLGVEQVKRPAVLELTDLSVKGV